MSEGTTTTDTAESTTTTTTTTISSNNSTIDKIHQTQAQWDAIEQEIKDTQPLTSAVRPLEDLRQQYQTGDGVSNKWYDLGVQVLMKTYLSIRVVRGDGNCYYRAFLYSMCEQLMNHPIELERITKLSTYLLFGLRSRGDGQFCTPFLHQADLDGLLTQRVMLRSLTSSSSSFLIPPFLVFIV